MGGEVVSDAFRTNKWLGNFSNVFVDRGVVGGWNERERGLTLVFR